MTHDRFEQYIEDGIAALPEWVQKKLVNIAFLILDEPSVEQRKEQQLSENETLFGLYEGVPLTERGNESPSMPDTITIFKRPILAAFETEVDIRTCVINTVWHEVAHYFGHEEEWIEEEERKRGKTL